MWYADFPGECYLIFLRRENLVAAALAASWKRKVENVWSSQVFSCWLEIFLSVSWCRVWGEMFLNHNFHTFMVIGIYLCVYMSWRLTSWLLPLSKEPFQSCWKLKKSRPAPGCRNTGWELGMRHAHNLFATYGISSPAPGTHWRRDWKWLKCQSRRSRVLGRFWSRHRPTHFEHLVEVYCIG